MNFVETPQLITWPETHYVFVEKIGQFQDTAMAAWQELHAKLPQVKVQPKTFLSLYNPELEIYRAGAVFDTKPASLPPGLQYEFFKGGSYKQFTLTGSYENLPEACGSVFEWLEENEIELRDDFCLEHYTNDPKTTPEEALVTNILMPVKNIPASAKPFKA